jgi:hypothetical protein
MTRGQCGSLLLHCVGHLLFLAGLPAHSEVTFVEGQQGARRATLEMLLESDLGKASELA